MRPNSKNYDEMFNLRQSGLTFQEIGNLFGISRQRVHQILMEPEYTTPPMEKQPDCINWRGKPNSKGYGVTARNGKTIAAHRLAWIEIYGEIPDDLCVLHTCDNRMCINPNHLYLGTQFDNINDRVIRRRGKPGRSYKKGDGMNKDKKKIFRISDDELRSLNTILNYLRKNNPGINYNESVAIRYAIIMTAGDIRLLEENEKREAQQ